jgi:hypothetical protein
MAPTVSSKPAKAGELLNRTFQPFTKYVNGDRFLSNRLHSTQTGIGAQIYVKFINEYLIIS